MHILVTNDDGPPSPTSAPYVHPLIVALQAAGHVVSVILPNQQRSWIGKAHFVDKTITPTFYIPGKVFENQGTVSEVPPEEDHWVLVDSTPATCVQIGLYHYFQERGPIDLVVSGPNLGRNSTVLFSLSSGTIGAAMEAGLCQKRAIALSFAYNSTDHDPVAIKEAAEHSVKLIQHLNNIWADNVDVYNVNVPLEKGISTKKIHYTQMFKNRWTTESSFDPVQVETQDGMPRTQFRWAPKLGHIHKTANDSGPGNDGWVVENGMTSVTPLQVNFMQTAGYEGEIQLP